MLLTRVVYVFIHCLLILGEEEHARTRALKEHARVTEVLESIYIIWLAQCEDPGIWAKVSADLPGYTVHRTSLPHIGAPLRGTDSKHPSPISLSKCTPIGFNGWSVDAEISKEFLKYYGLAYDVLRYQMWSEINSRLESVVGFMAPYLGLEGSTDEVKPKLREFAIQIRTFKRHTKDIWFAHILLNAKTRSNGH